MKKLLTLILMLMLSLSFLAFADDAKTEDSKNVDEVQYPVVDFGGVAYIHYVYDLDEESDYNGFELTRAYLDLKMNISKNIKFRVTPDFKRLGTKAIQGFIKYAYVELVDPLNIGMNVRIGMNPTAWEGYMTKWWGYRFINRTPSGTHGLTTSSDLGISLIGSLADKMISYQFAFRNGEGFGGSAEEDSGKTVEGTLELNLFKDFPLHLFGHARFAQETSEYDSQNNLYAGALYYKDKTVHIGGEYSYNEQEEGTRSVLGVMGSLTFDNLILLGRYDIFDPNVDVDGDTRNLLIAGVGYKLDKLVTVMLDLQLYSYKGDSSSDDTKIYLHWEINY